MTVRLSLYFSSALCFEPQLFLSLQDLLQQTRATLSVFPLSSALCYEPQLFVLPSFGELRLYTWLF